MIQSPAGYQGDVRIKRYLDFYQAGYGVAMLSSGATAFSPLSLFAANEPGGWYDPSDLTTLYQDAAGTTPVTAVEQPVGRVLDKSGRGNHLSQSTAAARPVLSARVNLLTETENFAAAAWTKGQMLPFGSGSVANATTAPNGTLTADLVVPNTTNTNHFVLRSVATTTATVLSVYAKKEGYDKLCIGTGGADFAYFDLTNGTVPAVGSSLTATISSAGDGWFLCKVVASSVPSWFAIYPFSGTPSGGAAPPTFSGNGTSGIYIWGADLRVANAGVGLPAYQRVGAATSGSSTAAGNADYDSGPEWPRYLRWDGTDDGMASSSIDFTSTDKIAVFAGVRKLSDAATGMLAELSASVLANVGSFFLTAPDSTSIRYSAASRGTTAVGLSQLADTASTSFNAPVTNVLRATHDIAGDVTALAVNGTVVDTATGDQGTGNFGNYPLFVGSRNNASFRFNGHIYGLVIVGRALTAAEISNMETWMNSKTLAF